MKVIVTLEVPYKVHSVVVWGLYKASSLASPGRVEKEKRKKECRVEDRTGLMWCEIAGRRW